MTDHLMRRLPLSLQRFFPVKLMAVATVAVLLSSCSFDQPVAPKWDVKMAIPLVNRIYTVQEMIEKNDFLLEGTDGLVNVDYEKDLDRFEVGDALQVDGVSQHIDSKIGKFRVPSPGSKMISLTFGQLFPQAQSLDGQQAPVPAFQFDNVTASLPRFENFESVLIESGIVRVTIKNRLPVPLSAGQSMDVRSQDTDESIFTIVFDHEIAPGETASRTVNLYGLRVPANLKVVLNGGSPGSGGDPVTINAYTDGLDVEAYISEIVAVEARAAVEPQVFSGADSIAIGDSIRVTEAVIKSGLFRFEFDNQLPLNMTLNLTLQDFYDPYGQPAKLELPLTTGQTTFRFINLSGYDFRPQQNDQGTVVHFNWSVQVEGSNEQIITLSSEDAIKLDVDLSDLTFSEIRGVLDNVHVSLDTISESIDLPDGLDSLKFEAGRLELLLNNGIGFPIHPHLTILGINEETGKSATITVDQVIAAANGHPTLSKIVLDEQNSNLIDFLNVMPTRIQVVGEATVGDGTSESVIRDTDFIESTIHITAPISLSYPTQTVKTEVDTIEVDKEAQKELQNNVLAGSFHARLGNHLPFGARVTLYFSSRDTSVFTRPELAIGPISLEAADVQNGRVVAEKPSLVDIELTQEQIAILGSPVVYSGMAITIPGSNGQIVRLYSDDYVSVKAFAEVTYHVDPEDSGNEK